MEKTRLGQGHVDTKGLEDMKLEPTMDAEDNGPVADMKEPPVIEKVQNPPPPPNGGWGWLQVAGSFMLFFNCWGTINAFGVFQTYYETNPLWHKTSSDISWIGSVQAFLLLSVGVLTGPLFDRGYFRHLVIAATFLIPFGFMMTSLCTQYWQTMLAQALVIGLGNGCLFVPSVAILPQYFTTKRALANGIAASGSSFGGIIYPIMLHHLIGRIGFPWATRCLGFLSLVTLLFSVLVMRPRYLPKEKRKVFDPAAFKDWPYTFFTLALVFLFLGFYAPLYYLQPYAIQKGIVDENLGYYLLPILNAASMPGRIIPGLITDRVGPLNMLIPASLITCIVAFGWIGITSLPGVIIFAILYGFFSGGFISVPPITIVWLCPDMRMVGTRMGQSFFVAALGLLIGAPIAGAILGDNGNYLGLQLFSAIMILVSGVLVVCARVAKVGWTFRAKT